VRCQKQNNSSLRIRKLVVPLKPEFIQIMSQNFSAVSDVLLKCLNNGYICSNAEL
jgi:hypothetical protein